MVWTLISILSIILSIIAIVLSCISISIFVGLKNSTHRIEFRPVPEPDNTMKFKDEEIEELAKDDPIGASVEMEKKLFKEMKLNPTVKGFQKLYDQDYY
jgi:hypothetical protein